MKKYKDFFNEKIKEKQNIDTQERLQILPNGENWRNYFDNYVLTDNEYIVYYNINNIIWLYRNYNDLSGLIGNLDDLDNPIVKTSLVDAINYVWENGSSGENQDTIKVLATYPENEGGENQSDININNQKTFNNINDNIVDLNEFVSLDDLIDPIPKTSVADAINYIWQNNGSNDNTTDVIIPVDSELEGGTTQQIINQNNVEAINNLEDEINSIINGDVQVITTTDKINTINPEIENGSTQQEVNQNNKEAIDTINQEINDINNNLPDMSNYYTKSEVDSLISDLQTQINACCNGTSAIIDNIVPTSPTTEDNNDGKISFDTEITNCNGEATAVLNPSNGLDPIVLENGINANLIFSPLLSGDYTIQIYCDTSLIKESETITIPNFIPISPIDDIVLPEEPDIIPAESTDIPVDDGKNFNHSLILTQIPMIPESDVQVYQNQIILGDYFDLNQWTTAGLNTYNPNDGQGDICYVAIRKTSDILFDTDRENVSNSISGINWIKAIDNINFIELLIPDEYNLNEVFTLNESYNNYKYLIAKQYYFSGAGTAQVHQWSYSIIETSNLNLTNIWRLKSQGNSATYQNIISFTDDLTGSLSDTYSNDYLVAIVGTNDLPNIDLNIVVSDTKITADDYSDGTFLLVNTTYDDTSISQIIYISSIIYDGITRYDFTGLGNMYLSFNSDLSINIINNTSHIININSIKKIIL